MERSYYYLLNHKNRHTGRMFDEYLKPLFDSLNKEKGINFKELEWDEMPSEDSKPYILYGVTNPLMFRDPETNFLKKLSEIEGAEIKAISVYPLIDGEDSEFYKEFAHTIPHEEKLCGCHILPANHIDNELSIRTVSKEEIAKAI